jgi:hypothetical protein
MLFEPEPELDEIRLREQGRFLAIPSITRSSSGTSQA